MCHPEVIPGQPAFPAETDEVVIPTPEGDLPALLARPGSEAVGGILLFHDVFGRTSFYEDLAARLATAGFRVVLPDFFHHEGPIAANSMEAASARRQRSDSRRMLREAVAALEWMRESVRGRIGIVGFCMGGSYTLGLAAQRDDLATVCYYGFPGRPLHFQQDPDGPTPIDLADSMRGPMIGFWGDQDEGVGMDNVARFAEAMRAHGGEFEHHVYPGAGHGFLRLSELALGNPLYEVACDSWTRTLAFFREHVGG
jgi:carboxymethylenebutenolidase